MSGARGSARKGNVKLKLKIIFRDTGKRVSTNIFVKKNAGMDDVQIKLNSKYPEKYPVLDRIRVA